MGLAAEQITESDAASPATAPVGRTEDDTKRAGKLTVHRTPGLTGVLDNPLIQRLVALNLERSDFVIFGSGPLLACGLRKSIRDLDVVARGAAWQRASTIGLSAVGVLTGDPIIHFWGGRIQCSQQWISPGWDSDKLIDKADIIDGLRFAKLADVLTYKQFLLRRKDIRDIRAITNYVRTMHQMGCGTGEIV
jgi:hypothetical protein